MSSPAPPPLIDDPEAFRSVLRAAQAGGEWALERLFVEYQPPLLRYLRGQANDVADDIASETWIAAARSLSGFAGGANEFRAWLFTIARHRLIDERRRASRRPIAVDASSMNEPISQETSTEDAVLDVLAGDEAARRIVALLPKDQADVILLRVVAGLTVEQVSVIVGKRPGAVRTMQSRGLQRLAERLQNNL